MRMIVLIGLLCMGITTGAQTVDLTTPANEREDSLIRANLISLALENPSAKAADYRVASAQYTLKSVKSTWLDAIAITGNINEFVVNNSPNSNFFPKYNLGISLPFSIFGKNSNLKKAANEQVNVNKALNEEERRRLIKEVLSRYETYKEKKDILELQKRITSDLEGAYKKVKQDYVDGVITDLDEVNKQFHAYIQQQIQERASKREYNVAVVDMEEIIGVPFSSVLQKVSNIMSAGIKK